MHTRLHPLVLTFAFAASSLHAQTAAPPPNPATAASSDLPPSSVSPDTPEPGPETAPTSGSEVRIVRLSQIKGEVQMDRNTDRGFEAAFPNLPITQHAKLRTAQGLAEVEFEDNSSLRLTPGTVVEFTQLSRAPSGSTLSTIHVLQGTVYVSLENTRTNQFLLTFGTQQTLTLAPSSHIELAIGPSTSKLAVFDGSVSVGRADGNILVGKKKELVFDPSNPSAPTLLTKVEKTPFDVWDKNQVDYHRHYANASAFGGTSAYGISDLNYYGSFTDLPGCGQVWRPYFTSAAWDPFSNGLWAWYPGAGYTWVSPYPWGWAPFHTGSWQLCSSGGWGWHPRGRWAGLRNSEKCPQGIHGPTHSRPPLPPSPGHATMIAINTRPIAASRLAGPDTFVFSKDSAGLGVPREGFGKLGKVSAGVEHHGAVTAPVHGGSALAPSYAASRTIRSSDSDNRGSNRPLTAAGSANSARGSATSSSGRPSYAGSSAGSSSGGSGSHTSSPASSGPAPAASGGGSHH